MMAIDNQHRLRFGKQIPFFVERKLKSLFPFFCPGFTFLHPVSGVQATTPDLQRPGAPWKLM